MRRYIFEFEQTILLKYKVNLEEALFLDYATRFFNSGYAVTTIIDGKSYHLLSYKKIFDDLPILKKSKRQFRRFLDNLEEKKLLKRCVPDGKNLYLHINQSLLFFDEGGHECPTDDDDDDIDVLPGGQKCPPIVKYNYNNNKIKIIHKDARMKHIDVDKFLYKLKENIKPKINKLAFEICFDKSSAQLADDFMIILNVSTPIILEEKPNNLFENCVIEVLNEMLDEIDLQ